MDFRLKKFDINSIDNDKVVVFIGKRDTGKSILVKDDIANETTQILISGITSSPNTKVEWSLEKI